MRTIITSRICGFFDGWHPNEEYYLQDGTAWQLVPSIVHVKWLQSPKANILQSGKRYFLKVEGMGKRQEVRSLSTVPVGPHPGAVPKSSKDWPSWFARALECELEQQRRAPS